MVEAVAQFDYPANDADELTLKTGDIIRNVIQQEGGWWEGELSGRRGVFPDNFVKIRSPSPAKEDNLINDVHLRRGTVRRCKAIFSYKPINDDELELQVEDVIEVIEEVEDGWWKGVLKGNTGVFPSNFVQEIEVPAVIPDVTSNKDRNVIQDQAVIDAKPKPVKGVAAIFHGGAPKLKHTPSDAEENKNEALPPQRPLSYFAQNSNEAPVLPPKQAKDQAKVLFTYEAQNEDELTITEGDIITVLSKDVEDKGWWKGELNGRTGVFPDNFVELIPHTEPLRPKKPDRVDKSLSSAKQSAMNLPLNVTDSASAKVNSKDGEIPSPQNRNIYPPLPGAVKLPDFPKKEDKPDRPAPPLPIKKPLIPPPMKKTNRLSSPGTTSFDGMTDEMKTKTNQEPSNNPAQLGDDLDLDSIPRTSEKLDHKTAQRPKYPNRRPPSHYIPKENHDEDEEKEKEKENKDVGKETPAPWMQELMRNQAMKRVSHEAKSNNKDAGDSRNGEERPGPKLVSSRPSAEVPDSKPLPTKPVIPKPPLPAVAKPPINVKASVLDKRSRLGVFMPDSTTSVHLDAESSLPDVIRTILMWKDHYATKTSLEETRREVRELHDSLDLLKAELESEKRARITLQSELDSLKRTMANK